MAAGFHSSLRDVLTTFPVSWLKTERKKATKNFSFSSLTCMQSPVGGILERLHSLENWTEKCFHSACPV